MIIVKIYGVTRDQLQEDAQRFADAKYMESAYDASQTFQYIQSEIPRRLNRQKSLKVLVENVHVEFVPEADHGQQRLLSLNATVDAWILPGKWQANPGLAKKIQTKIAEIILRLMIRKTPWFKPRCVVQLHPNTDIFSL